MYYFTENKKISNTMVYNWFSSDEFEKKINLS